MVCSHFKQSAAVLQERYVSRVNLDTYFVVHIKIHTLKDKN